MGMLAAEKLKMNCLSGFLLPMSVQLFKRPALLMTLVTHPSVMQVNMQFVNGLTMPHIMIFKKLTPEEEADVRQFEGNAQGLRLLTRIDYHPDDGGMRLTYATLGAYLKYPWLSKTIASQGDRPSHQRAKFGCYQSEKEILKQIAEQLGLIQLGEYHYCRHPLTYLLEAADDICYALIDLEDGIILNMLNYQEVEPIFLNLIADYGQPEELSLPSSTWQQKISALRGRVMKRLVDEVTTAFAKHHYEIITGQLKGSLLQYCSPDIAAGIETAKNLAREKSSNTHKSLV